jgi:hypothetical protein
MTNLITETVEQRLPSKRKSSSGGWTSFDAVCCHHRGESKDRRKRAGIRFDADGFTYHCFNCGFKAGWIPGKLLSANTKNLFKWLNFSDNELAQVGFEVLRLKENLPQPKKIEPANLKFNTVELPEGSRPITQALAETLSEDCAAVAEHLLMRRLDPNRYMWADQEPGFNRRFIIPFTHQGRIVGWTARSIDKIKVAKYLSNQQPHYVYGLDRQCPNQSWVFVVEGPLDADQVSGCALLGSQLSEPQRRQIERPGATPVLIPDRDRAGFGLAEQVLEHGWALSLPEWHDDVKDIADAVQRYGTAYTVVSIVKAIETSVLKNRLKLRSLQGKIIDKKYG